MNCSDSDVQGVCLGICRQIRAAQQLSFQGMGIVGYAQERNIFKEPQSFRRQ